MDMNREQELVARARSGDRQALVELLEEVKHPVYNLAIRMLGSPADAEDAAQEILIRLVTNLDGFRGDSSFKTWVYRVAANHLLKTRQRPGEALFGSFEALAEYLDEGANDNRPTLDDALLLREAKLRCTSAMVLRLDREHRLAFILGEILELSSDDAAAASGISTEAFRKRLSRARSRMVDFTLQTCGLVNQAVPCRCAKQATHAASQGRLDRGQVAWAKLPVLPEGQETLVTELDRLQAAVIALRSHPQYAAPEALVQAIKQLVAPGREGLLA